MFKKALVIILCFMMVFSLRSQIPAAAENRQTALVETKRLSGNDRYDTAVQIAKCGWSSADTAIIVSGENFPDALSAAPLAKKFNAPILLASQNNISNNTLNELKQLGVKQIYIIGGSGALSSKVVKSLSGYNVQRIAGNDRFETSVRIAEKLGPCSEAFIVTGENFPDALSAAPVAAKKGIPLLLTSKNSLPDSVKTFLTTHNISKTYVVGGSDIISSKVVAELPNPEIVNGVDRYDRSVNIINKFSSELDFTNVYLATGLNFPDALAGSTLASKTSSPIILLYPIPSSSTKKLISDKSALIKSKKVLGGTSVISDQTLSNLVSGPDNTSDNDTNNTGNDCESQIKSALTNKTTAVFQISKDYKDFNFNNTAMGFVTSAGVVANLSSEKAQSNLISSIAGQTIRITAGVVSVDESSRVCSLEILPGNKGIAITITQGNMMSVVQSKVQGVVKGNTLTGKAEKQITTVINYVGGGENEWGDFSASIRKLAENDAPPLAPVQLKGTELSDGSIQLNWVDPNPQGYVKEYDIYRMATDYSYNFIKIATIPSCTSWIDSSDVAKKQSYTIHYFIIARGNTGSVSASSNSAMVILRIGR